MNFEDGFDKALHLLANIAGKLTALAIFVVILGIIIFKVPVFIQKAWNQFSNTFLK